MRGAGEGEPAREPSWTTALSETEAALRQLRQATASLDRASREIQALREWGETMARLELARALTDGPDGGVLAALVASASDPAGDGDTRRATQALLERLTTAVGLQPIAERGERLLLRPHELAELDVRGGRASADGDDPSCDCDVRPGWLVDGVVVTRPLLEPVSL